MKKKAVWRALGIGVALLAAIVVYRVVSGGDSTPRGEARPAPARLGQGFSALPKPKRPAFEVGRPVLLQGGATEARYAPVLWDAEARDAPTPAARPVAEVGRMTSDGTTNIVLVIGRARRAGAPWVHIRLPVLPNNETGWVPRRALGGYRFVHTHLVIDREHFAATLYSGRRVVFRAPVGVGRPEAPTPRGEFYVRDKLTNFNDPFYGPVAFGTSARSAVLTDWPGGGFVGIHGTNEPDLIPGRISHGCVRLRNEDIVRLSRLMPIGTPITVV